MSHVWMIRWVIQRMIQWMIHVPHLTHMIYVYVISLSRTHCRPQTRWRFTTTRSRQKWFYYWARKKKAFPKNSCTWSTRALKSRSWVWFVRWMCMFLQPAASGSGRSSAFRKHAATHCNTLQHTATHNTACCIWQWTQQAPSVNTSINMPEATLIQLSLSLKVAHPKRTWAPLRYDLLVSTIDILFSKRSKFPPRVAWRRLIPRRSFWSFGELFSFLFSIFLSRTFFWNDSRTTQPRRGYAGRGWLKLTLSLTEGRRWDKRHRQRSTAVSW